MISVTDKQYEAIIDRSVEDMVATFINGNRNEVIANLSMRHPAIAAHFILHGAQNGLSVADCNSVVNQLMDNMMEVRDRDGIEATHRPWRYVHADTE